MPCPDCAEAYRKLSTLEKLEEVKRRIVGRLEDRIKELSKRIEEQDRDIYNLLGDGGEA